MHRVLFCLPVAGAVALAACSRNEPAFRTPVGVTNPQPGTVENAVSRIADAQCEREQRCDNIGLHKRFETREVCIDDARQGEGGDLRAANCDVGVDDAQLGKCLAAIHYQSCGSPVISAMQLDACRASLLCIK
jgi:hypothetical protein